MTYYWDAAYASVFDTGMPQREGHIPCDTRHELSVYIYHSKPHTVNQSPNMHPLVYCSVPEVVIKVVSIHVQSIPPDVVSP